MDWGLIPPSLPPSPLFAPRGLLLGATSPLLLPSFPLFWTGDKSPAGEKQPAGCFRCFRCYQDGRFGRARFDGVFIGERAENNLMPLLTPISIPLLLLTDTSIIMPSFFGDDEFSFLTPTERGGSMMRMRVTMNVLRRAPLLLPLRKATMSKSSCTLLPQF